MIISKKHKKDKKEEQFFKQLFVPPTLFQQGIRLQTTKADKSFDFISKPYEPFQPSPVVTPTTSPVVSPTTSPVVTPTTSPIVTPVTSPSTSPTPSRPLPKFTLASYEDSKNIYNDFADSGEKDINDMLPHDIYHRATNSFQAIQQYLNYGSPVAMTAILAQDYFEYQPTDYKFTLEDFKEMTLAIPRAVAYPIKKINLKNATQLFRLAEPRAVTYPIADPEFGTINYGNIEYNSNYKEYIKSRGVYKGKSIKAQNRFISGELKKPPRTKFGNIYKNFIQKQTTRPYRSYQSRSDEVELTDKDYLDSQERLFKKANDYASRQMESVDDAPPETVDTSELEGIQLDDDDPVVTDPVQSRIPVVVDDPVVDDPVVDDPVVDDPVVVDDDAPPVLVDDPVVTPTPESTLLKLNRTNFNKSYTDLETKMTQLNTINEEGANILSKMKVATSDVKLTALKAAAKLQFEDLQTAIKNVEAAERVFNTNKIAFTTRLESEGFETTSAEEIIIQRASVEIPAKLKFFNLIDGSALIQQAGKDGEDNISSLVQERSANFRIAISSLDGEYGIKLIIPESVRATILKTTSSDGYKTAIDSWYTKTKLDIEAPITEASTSLADTFKSLQTASTELQRINSLAYDALVILSDPSDSSSWAKARATARKLAVQAKTQAAKVDEFELTYQTKLGTYQKLLVDQTSNIKAVDSSSTGYKLTSLEEANKTKAITIAAKTKLVKDGADNINSLIENIDKSRRLAIAGKASLLEHDKTLANIQSQQNLDDMDNNIDEKTTELETLKDEIDAAKIEVLTSLKGADFSDSNFLTGNQSKLAQLQLDKSDFGTKYNDYLNKLKALNQLITDRNASTSFQTLKVNGQSPTELDSISDAYLLKTGKTLTQVTSEIKQGAKDIAKVMMDEGVTLYGEAQAAEAEKLATLRSDYSSINTKYTNLRQQLTKISNKINDPAFNDLEVSQKTALLRQQATISREYDTALANKTQAQADLTEELNQLKAIPDAAINKVNTFFQDNNLGQPPDPSPELADDSSALGTELDSLTSDTAPLLQRTSIAKSLMQGIGSRFMSNAKNSFAGSNLSRVATTELSNVRMAAGIEGVAGNIKDYVASGLRDTFMETNFVGRATQSGIGAILASSGLGGSSVGKITASVLGRSASVLSKAIGPAGYVYQGVDWAIMFINRLKRGSHDYTEGHSWEINNDTSNQRLMPLIHGIPSSSPLRNRATNNYDGRETMSYLNWSAYYLEQPQADNPFYKNLINDRHTNEAAASGDFDLFTSFNPLDIIIPYKWIDMFSTYIGGPDQTMLQQQDFFVSIYGYMRNDYMQLLAQGFSKSDAATKAVATMNTKVQLSKTKDVPLYITLSNYDEDTSDTNYLGFQYNAINGYNEQDTADFLATYRLNPYAFYGLNKEALEFMGLPQAMYKNPDYITNNPAGWTNATKNPLYEAAWATAESQQLSAVANTVVDSYRKLIANVPADDEATRLYYMGQLKILQQQPDVNTYLSDQNKLIAVGTPDLDQVQELFPQAVESPYFASIQAAWMSQSDTFTNVEDFQEEDDYGNLGLPNWFSYDTTFGEQFGITSGESQILIENATLVQQLGLYDYNLALLGSEGNMIQNSEHNYTNYRIGLDVLDQGISGLNALLNNDPTAVFEGNNFVLNHGINDIIDAYETQFKSEGVSNSRQAAIAAVIAKLQLAKREQKTINITSVTHQDNTLIGSSMIQELNVHQLSYYTALYQENNDLYLGYSKQLLRGLGLNENLSLGALADGETVQSKFDAVQLDIDQDVVNKYKVIIEARDSQVANLNNSSVDDVNSSIAQTVIDSVTGKGAVEQPGDKSPADTAPKPKAGGTVGSGGK